MGASAILAMGLTAIFLAFVLVLGTIGVVTQERQQVSRSLASLQAIEALPASLPRQLDRPFGERVLGPALGRLSGLGRRFTPTGQLDRIRRRLEMAGSPARWDVDRVVAFKMLGLLGGIALGVLAVLALGGRPLVLLLAVALPVLGLFGPDIVLISAADRRAQQMRRELPDALDLLSISVEAGLGFDAALSQVARNTTGPLADEFFRVLQEMQIGLGRSDALRALAERSDLPELRGFITSMVQADSFGIPIANVLRIQAKELRVKRSQWAEEKAQKVPIKILFPLIFCILPSLFIVIVGPAAIGIVHAFSGH